MLSTPLKCKLQSCWKGKHSFQNYPGEGILTHSINQCSMTFHSRDIAVFLTLYTVMFFLTFLQFSLRNSSVLFWRHYFLRNQETQFRNHFAIRTTVNIFLAVMVWQWKVNSGYDNTKLFYFFSQLNNYSFQLDLCCVQYYSFMGKSRLMVGQVSLW